MVPGGETTIPGTGVGMVVVLQDIQGAMLHCALPLQALAEELAGC